MLPFELVYEIRDFLPWRHRCIMVSREWLRGVEKADLDTQMAFKKALVFIYSSFWKWIC